jgi:hypothetical protein
MSWPKMAIIKFAKFGFYKETAVFAIIILDISLLIIPCTCLQLNNDIFWLMF